MEYVLSRHAQDLSARRGIPIAWVERVLEKPLKTETDRVNDSLEHRLGPIVEHGNRVLRVIINNRTNPLKVVTFYFDRNMRHKL
jgi:hypothetical protein